VTDPDNRFLRASGGGFTLGYPVDAGGGGSRLAASKSCISNAHLVKCSLRSRATTSSWARVVSRWLFPDPGFPKTRTFPFRSRKLPSSSVRNCRAKLSGPGVNRRKPDRKAPGLLRHGCSESGRQNRWQRWALPAAAGRHIPWPRASGRISAGARHKCGGGMRLAELSQLGAFSGEI